MAQARRSSAKKTIQAQAEPELSALLQNEDGTPLTVEESFQAIEARIGALEDAELSLEDAFALYREGMELVRYAGVSIDAVEQRVQMLSKDGELEEFA